MKEKIFDKVKRVYLINRTSKVGGRLYKRTPYWIGCWRERGKEFTVHIGKVLPDKLTKLLERRVKLIGDERYTWGK